MDQKEAILGNRGRRLKADVLEFAILYPVAGRAIRPRAYLALLLGHHISPAFGPNAECVMPELAAVQLKLNPNCKVRGMPTRPPPHLVDAASVAQRVIQ